MKETKTTTAADNDDDSSASFAKRLGKWESSVRGDWRYEERPRHRDFTIAAINNSDRLTAGLKGDMAVLDDAEKSLLALHAYVANNGSHGVPLPVAVSAEECMRVKRNTQEKLGRHALQQRLEQQQQQQHQRVGLEEAVPEVLAAVTLPSAVVSTPYVGVDTFLTAAPYDEVGGGADENEDCTNEAEVVDREDSGYGGGGGGHSSSMLQIVKRHNSFRLRKQALLQKQHVAPPSLSVVSTATDAQQPVGPEPDPPVVAPTSSATRTLRDSLTDLVGADGPSSDAAAVVAAAAVASHPHQLLREDDRSAQPPTADYETEQRYLEQQQRMLLLRHQQQLLQHHQLHQYDYHFDPSDGQLQSHPSSSSSAAAADVSSRYHDVSHAEALLREAEKRAAALDGEEDEFIERIRRHERLRHVVEQDLQSYDRNVPDVKKTQESWRAAKREHALAAERQAREEAERAAKLESERAAKAAAKAAAQMEALAKFMELKEMKAKKARKARRRRSSEDGNQDGSAGGADDSTAADVSCGTGATNSKALARSKSAHLASSGGDTYHPSWPRDNGRVEYHGAHAQRAAAAEAAAAKDAATAAVLQSKALAKPELGNGEKWLKAMLAEQKAAAAKEVKAAATAAATAATAKASTADAPGGRHDAKKQVVAAPPAMSRRQAVEAAKEKKREEERAWEAARDAKAKGQGHGQVKGGPKKKKRASAAAAAAAAAASQGADPHLEELLAAAAAADWDSTEAGLRRDFQSALSLLSPPGTLTAGAPPPQTLLTASPGVGSYAAPPTHWSGMGSIEHAVGAGGGAAAYFPSFPGAALDSSVGRGAGAGAGAGVGHGFPPPSSSAAGGALYGPPSVASAYSAPRGAVAEAFPIALRPTPAPAPAPTTASSSSGAPFFDPVSSTADKGRHRVQDPRDFEADSIRCVPDGENRAVTLVTGKRRRRFNPLADLGTAPAPAPAPAPATDATAEVVAVLFDRHVFASEAEARVWWLTHQARVVAGVQRG